MIEQGSKRALPLLVSVLLSSVLLVACNDSISVPDKTSTQGDVVGSDADKHGCKASAGYSWCAKTNQCERPWELAKKELFDNTEEAFTAFCAGSEK